MKNKAFTMIELFSGIGAQERALRQLKIPYKIINTCDCDKDAVLSYTAMRFDIDSAMNTYQFPTQDKMIEELQNKGFGYDFMKSKHTISNRTPINKLKQYYIADKLSNNLGDISKVERLPYADMVTYSFPCTDLSVAGKGEGMINKCSCGYSWPIDFSDDSESLICPSCGAKVQSSTRSGLLGQVQRLLAVSKKENTLPKYLLLENVKNLVGKKFKPQFDAWVKWLDSIGYNTYYQVLNSKHYGIPQNRERIFALSIRKDINNGNFKFPEQIPLTTRLKDILEKDVDEKYYLSGDKVEKILANFIARQNESNEPNIIKVGQLDSSFDQSGRVYSAEGIAPTVMSNSHGKTSGGYTSPKILVDENSDRLIKVEVPQTVNVRKYEVDIDGLQTLLRDAKSKSSFTNKDIAEKLNQSLTTVEHWFRTDECFSIPAPDVWMSLKELLNITTNEFDESITTFEERLGVFEKSNRCYLENGISPTITCGQNEKIIVSEKSNVEPFIVASRGRNPENPSDRTAGSPTELRILVVGCAI